MARFCGFWLCVLGVWVFWVGVGLLCVCFWVCVSCCVRWCVVGLAVSFESVYVLGACVKYACLVVGCFLWVVV